MLLIPLCHKFILLSIHELSPPVSEINVRVLFVEYAYDAAYLRSTQGIQHSRYSVLVNSLFSVHACWRSLRQPYPSTSNGELLLRRRRIRAVLSRFLVSICREGAAPLRSPPLIWSPPGTLVLISAESVEVGSSADHNKALPITNALVLCFLCSVQRECCQQSCQVVPTFCVRSCWILPHSHARVPLPSFAVLSPPTGRDSSQVQGIHSQFSHNGPVASKSPAFLFSALHGKGEGESFDR